MIDFRSKRPFVRECRKRISAIQRPPEHMQGRKMTQTMGKSKKPCSAGIQGRTTGQKTVEGYPLNRESSVGRVCRTSIDRLALFDYTRAIVPGPIHLPHR
jgi:hypothetical protein